MNYRQDAADMLQCLAEALEDPAPAFDANNHYATVVADIPFAFFYENEPPCLFIQAKIAEATRLENACEILEELLKRSHLWQSTARGNIGLNPDDDVFYYSYAIPFPYTEESRTPRELLRELIPFMVGAIESARDIIHPESEGSTTPRQNASAFIDPGSMA